MGSAILFNKDTFYSDISVTSIYLHDTRRGVQGDQVNEGEEEWVFTRCSFTCLFLSSWPVDRSSLMSLHYQQHLHQEERHHLKLIHILCAIMISQEVDLVAGDFNGTAWRCRSRDNLSTIDEAFADCALPTPTAPHRCGDPDPSIPNSWADVCGFLNPPGSQRFWKVSKHGAFSILRKALGLRPNDQSCHHETWLHLHFVDWNNKWSHQAYYIRLKERPASSGYICEL